MSDAETDVVDDDDNDEKGDVAIAMVATSSTRLPPAPAIIAAAGGPSPKSASLLGRLFGAKPGAAKDQQWQDNNLVFNFRDGMIAVAMMPGPLPWSDLEGPCATAWWWPEATERMRTHRYVVLVSVMGGTMPPIERRVILTRVCAAVTQHTDAVGVYWPEGTLVHEPKRFVEQTAGVTADQIPGPLWIDVRIEQNDDGDTLRCFTTGLAPLGLMEIEVERARLEPADLLGFVGDTACYVANNNLVINDGETMGRTAEEKFKVRHAPSMFGRGQVMQIEME